MTMRRRCDDDGDDEDEDRCMHFDLYVLSALGADSADFNKYTTAFNINGARFYIRQHVFCFCFFFFVVVFSCDCYTHHSLYSDGTVSFG